jgi:ubiquinone/menaquinone biosynthesis C-methylase UbiE
MAVKYPNSTFIGLDMSPLFLDINDDEDKPTNLAFLEHNICNGIPFHSKTFDFIFQRSMIISLNKSQWNNMLGEFARTIKPGGWLELMELQINELNLTKTARKFQKARK